MPTRRGFAEWARQTRLRAAPMAETGFQSGPAHRSAAVGSAAGAGIAGPDIAAVRGTVLDIEPVAAAVEMVRSAHRLGGGAADHRTDRRTGPQPAQPRA